MVGTFACPECGSAVAPRGHSAGRNVRCWACGTLVEIPFLPRAIGRGGASRGRKAWIWPAVGLVGAVLMVAVAVSIAGARGHAARVAEVDAALAEADAAAKSGQPDEALARADAAVKRARSLGAATRKATQARRDGLALRVAEARLAAVDASPAPVEALRALLARVEADRAMDPVRDRAYAALNAALSRKAETDLAQAVRALASGHDPLALGLCEGVVKLADELGRDRAGDLKREARDAAEAAISRRGVVLELVTGDFLDGPGASRAHSAALHPILANALAQKGYLPRPARSAFLDLWDSASPYRVATEVVERADGTFFQTPLHTASMAGHVALKKDGHLVWQCRPRGKTRVPLPSMSAFEMSNYSLARKRDAAMEKRLYEDACTTLAESLGGLLRDLPAPGRPRAGDAPTQD